MRALSVINEKKRRLRVVKEQLADVQNDFKLFKERTAAAASAAAAAHASSPMKKRQKMAGSADAKAYSSQSESLKETSGGCVTQTSMPPQKRSSVSSECSGTVTNVMGSAVAAAHVERAAETTPHFSQMSQGSVSTQELTRNFPWANLGL